MKTTSLVLFFGLAGVLVGHPSSAVAASIAPLVITRIDSPATQNLSAIGDLDFAYWNSTATGQSGAPSNDRSGATIIGDLSVVGGSSIRGSAAAGTLSYNYTGGTSPAAGTVTSPGLVFNATLGGSAVDKGLQLSLAGSSTTDRYVTLFLGGFGATGRLTLTLAGATTVVDATQVFPASSPKQLAAYSFSFRTDNPGDLLNVSFVTAATSDGNAHVGFGAVAVSAFPQAVVPEPSSALLGALGFVFVGLRRRARG